jgi:hypothetical protein
MRAETGNLKNGALQLAGLLVFLVFGTPLLAQERGWVFLGEAHVDGGRDHDRIKVGRSPESFRAIEFRVEGGDVEFDRIKVHFRNGTASDRLMHVRIPAGGKSRALDLPGDRRIIKSVEIWYRKNSSGARPTVSLFGHH